MSFSRERSDRMTAAGPQQLLLPVRIACCAPAAREVFVAGTFNGWNPSATPLVRDADGNWSVTVELVPGRYEFKFVVDGAWCCEPGCKEPGRDCPCCVPNGFGTMNRKMEVR
jgi:1,4-alpha-glucan branching enzyme